MGAEGLACAKPTVTVDTDSVPVPGWEVQPIVASASTKTGSKALRIKVVEVGIGLRHIVGLPNIRIHQYHFLPSIFSAWNEPKQICED
jgi:hypothetical protein